MANGFIPDMTPPAASPMPLGRPMPAPKPPTAPKAPSVGKKSLNPRQKKLLAVKKKQGGK